jgi:hypothetical protein
VEQKLRTIKPGSQNPFTEFGNEKTCGEKPRAWPRAGYQQNEQGKGHPLQHSVWQAEHFLPMLTTLTKLPSQQVCGQDVAPGKKTAKPRLPEG